MDELKKIKKLYGEEMMHLCRDLFPSILETPEELIDILTNHIFPTKMLYKDIINNGLECDFKSFIYQFVDLDEYKAITDKTPFELLRSVGYTLYECKTEEDIQKFKRYYAESEVLCTFNGRRLDSCHVFFAVKNDADNLNRNDFISPRREDSYGTSVISIQFSKGENNTLSIKNRYNHTVENPDATFSNNLEAIIPGLTYSFEKHYNLNIVQSNSSESFFNNMKYVKASNGKYYRYNMEINNIYYCENNIIIDNGYVIKKYNKEKERYILMDYFILDLKEKRMFLYDDKLYDAFINYFDSNIKRIDVINEKKNKKISFEDNNSNVIIKIDNSGNIMYYKNDNIKCVGYNFLRYNRNLSQISLNNVERIQNRFLSKNICLDKISFPKLKVVYDYFLESNTIIKEINIPKIESIGDKFMKSNLEVKKLYFGKLREVGNMFFANNNIISNLYLPTLESVGDYFLYQNKYLKRIKLNNLKIIGDFFLFHNRDIFELNLENVIKIGTMFMYFNEKIKDLFLPNVDNIGHSFFFLNEILESFYAPNLTVVPESFNQNKKMKKFIVSPDAIFSSNFMMHNESARHSLSKQYKNFDECEFNKYLIKK